MTDHLSKEKRSVNMSKILSTHTKPEIVVRSLLHGMGYRFRLYRKDLPGKPDIVLPKYKTVIFVNGCFWHRHADCRYSTTPKSNQDYWFRKFERNVERDSLNHQRLEKLGWNILVIWECEVKEQELLYNKLKDHFGRIQLGSSK